MQLPRWRRPGLLSIVVCCLIAGSACGASVRGRQGGPDACWHDQTLPTPALCAQPPIRGIMGKLASIEAKEKNIERQMDDYGAQETAEKVRHSVSRMLDDADGEEKRSMEFEAVDMLRKQFGVGGARPRFAESKTSLATKAKAPTPAGGAAPTRAERSPAPQASGDGASESAVSQSAERPADQASSEDEAAWADDDSGVKFAAAPAPGAARPKFSESGVSLGDSEDGDGAGSDADGGDASNTLEKEVEEEIEREGGGNSGDDAGSASGEELEEEEEVEREEREAAQQMAQAQVRACRAVCAPGTCVTLLDAPFPGRRRR